MLDKFFRMSILFDFYGALLTEKQQCCLELHFQADLSLSEIADQFGVSRQAVYDIIHRSEQSLEEYEAKLKLVERYQVEQHDLSLILLQMKKLTAELDLQNRAPAQQILAKIESLIGRFKEA